MTVYKHRVVYVDNSRGADRKVEFVCDDMSAQGWELVASLADNSGGYSYSYRLIFRRPVEQP
jgi:hypothetical protein